MAAQSLANLQQSFPNGKAAGNCLSPGNFPVALENNLGQNSWTLQVTPWPTAIPRQCRTWERLYISKAEPLIQRQVKRYSTYWGLQHSKRCMSSRPHWAAPDCFLHAGASHGHRKGVGPAPLSPTGSAVFTHVQRRQQQSHSPATVGLELFLQDGKGMPRKKILRTTNWIQLIYFVNLCLLQKNAKMKHKKACFVINTSENYTEIQF